MNNTTAQSEHSRAEISAENSRQEEFAETVSTPPTGGQIQGAGMSVRRRKEAVRKGRWSRRHA